MHDSGRAATGVRLRVGTLFVVAALACQVGTSDAPPLPASGLHRLQASGPAADALLARGARLVADYGTFRILDASPAAIAGLAPGPGIEFRNDYLRLSLNSGDLDTSLPDRTAGALSVPAVGAAGKALHLVQFPGPVRREWLAHLEATGARIVSYAPANGYLVYGDAPALERLASLRAAREVQFDAAYLPAHKLDRALAVEDTGSYAIQLVEDAAVNAETLALVHGLERAPGSVQAALGYVNLVVHADRAAMEAIAARPDVVSVQPWSEPRLLDERQDVIVAGQLAGALPTGPGYLAWLASKGFTQEQFDASGFGVDVSDSGVDAGTTLPNHYALYRLGDVAGRSRLAYARLEGTPHLGSTLEGCDGHGNLNAHIVGGYSDLSGAVHEDVDGYRYDLGVAPFVRLGSSVVFDPSTYTNPDFEDLVSRAYADGMRISSNSWGENVSAYTFDCQRYDALVRDAQPDGSAIPQAGNQEMVIVFAAGNAGAGGAGTIGAPGNAKNVISVGASENVRPLGGADRCGFLDTGADAALDVATFSSRGPAADGRVRPDLLAPGTHVTGGVAQAPEQRASPPASATGAQLACFSAAHVCGGVGSAYFPAGQTWYTASSGTSHATPAVAGAAALVRQWFLNEGRPPPSPAMTKAVLVNAARYMTGAGANDTLFSNAQGMGLVDLGAIFDGPPRLLRDQEPDDLFTATGQTRVFSDVVADPTRPFRVTLAWTDAPGATFAAAYQNDLDLTVQVGGQTYRGNVFTGATSTAGGVADAKNNVESVFLPAGTSGPYTVTVTAASIGSDGVPGNGTGLDQDFALVVGNGCATPLPPAPTGVAAVPVAPNTLSVSWTPGTAAEYLVYRSTLPGGPQELVATVLAPPFVDAGRSGGVAYAYVVRARQGCALSPASATASATPSGACLLSPAFAGLASVATTGAAVCGNALAWAPATPRCGGTISYDVFRGTTAGFVPDATTRVATRLQATTFVDVNLTGGTTYRYVVRAVETTAEAAVPDANTVERSSAPFLVSVPVRDDFDLNRPADAAAWWIEQSIAPPPPAADPVNVVSGCRWSSGSSAYRIGPTAAACGGTYANNTQAELVLGGDGSVSPVVNGIRIPPGGRATLTFRVAYQLDNGSDGVYLAYSTAGTSAASFSYIPDAVTPGSPYLVSGGYDATVTALGSRRAWTGTSLPPNGAFREVVVNLDALAGQTVWIGWRFGTDATGVLEGFYLDDVRLEIRDPACSSCATTPPPAPTGIDAAPTAANEVTVTWTPNGAPSYEVVRSDTAGGPWLLAGTVGAPPFVDAGRSAGVTYHYVVNARQGCALSAPSAEATVTATGACLLPPAFAGLSTATTTGAATCGNELAWFAATPSCLGTVTYDVFRGTTSGFTPGPANRIATGIAGTRYVDTADLAGGTPYFYVVRAVEAAATGTNSDGNMAERSATPARVSLAFGDDFDFGRPANAPAWWIEQAPLGARQLQIVKGCRWQSADTAYRFGQTSAACGGTYPISTTNQLVLGGDGSAGPNGFAIPAGGTGTLAFRLWYRFENGRDGATLGYSTTGPAGPFAQVLDSPSTTAPYIVTGGYDQAMLSGALVGQRAWTGVLGGDLPNGTLKQVVVNLDALAGRTVWFGWRIAADSVAGTTPPNKSFEGLFLDDVAVDARSSACTPATSQPGPAVRLAITGLPATVTADQPVTVTVTALDASGRIATGHAGTAVLASSDPAAVLPPTVTFAGGVASAAVRFRTAGTRTLTATDAANAGIGGSASTSVGAGPAARYALTGPSAAIAGAQVTYALQALDAFSNPVTAYARTASAASDDPTATLPLSVAFTGGLATAAVTFRTSGARTLTFTESAGSASGSIVVTVSSAAPSRISISGLPPSVTADAPVTVALTALDAFGQIATGYAGTAALTSSDAAAVLPAPVPFTAGRASATVRFHTAGSRTLTATDPANAALAGSASTTVGPAAPAALRFVVPPASAVAGQVLSPAPSVEIVDAFGNRTASAASVALSLATGPTGATLSGTTLVPAAAGVATFSGLALDRAGSGYALLASSGTLASATSAPFAVAAGAATRYALSGPATAAAGTPVTYALEALDAFSNLASTYAGTARATSDDPSATLPVAIVFAAGQATAAVTFRTAGAHGFAATDLANAAVAGSAATTVVAGGAAALRFVAQPSSGVAGQALSPAPSVEVVDAFGNRTSSTASVAVALASGPTGATLGGTAAVAAVAGVATFPDLLLSTAGTGYALRATSGTLTSATSTAFAVAAGPATRYAVSGPASATAGVPVAYTLQALDAFSNPVTTYARTAGATSDDPAAALPASVAFSGGRASAFATFGTAGARTLTFTETGGAAAGAVTVDVRPGAASHLVVSGLPATVTADQPVTLTLTVVDAAGQVATGHSGQAALSSDDPQAVLPGGPVAFTGGVATATVRLRTAGPRTVIATDVSSAALTGSAATAVQPGAVTRYAVSGPAIATAGVQADYFLQARDAFSNAATSYAGTATVTSNDAAATLPGPIAFAGGQATAAVTFRTAGTRTLTFADLAGPARATASVVVESAAPPPGGGGSGSGGGGGGCGYGSNASGASVLLAAVALLLRARPATPGKRQGAARAG